MEEENYDFGQCCACGKVGKNVRNFAMLDKLAPVPGKGWGCVVCDLPQNGAMAVVCDKCMDTGAELKYAISGYPNDKQRIPYSSLKGEQKHNEMAHMIDDNRILPG